jgi:hypothetical protein
VVVVVLLTVVVVVVVVVVLVRVVLVVERNAVKASTCPLNACTVLASSNSETVLFSTPLPRITTLRGRVARGYVCAWGARGGDE